MSDRRNFLATLISGIAASQGLRLQTEEAETLAAEATLETGSMIFGQLALMPAYALTFRVGEEIYHLPVYVSADKAYPSQVYMSEHHAGDLINTLVPKPRPLIPPPSKP